MQYSEFVTELEHILGERSDLESRIKTWLNTSVERITRLWPFQELRGLTDVSTAASTKTYSIVSDFGLTNLRMIESIRLIDGSNSWKLKYVVPTRLDQDEARPLTYGYGRPRVYTRWGDNFEFTDYIPSAIYTLRIRYHNYPTAMSLDADTPSISNVDDLIIAATAAWAYATLQENSDSEYWAKVTSGLWTDIFKDLSVEYDYTPQMHGFSPEQGSVGEYWNNPFIKSVSD